MKKIKIYNDGSEPKLWTRVLLLQCSGIFAYWFLPFSIESLILLLGTVVFTPLIALIFFED